MLTASDQEIRTLKTQPIICIFFGYIQTPWKATFWWTEVKLR